MDSKAIKQKIYDALDIDKCYEDLAEAGEKLIKCINLLNHAELKVESAKRDLAEREDSLAVVKFDIHMRAWPTIDGKDPVTGRSNKDWAEAQLLAELKVDPDFEEATRSVTYGRNLVSGFEDEALTAKANVKVEQIRYSVAGKRLEAAVAKMQWFVEGS